MRIEEFDYDLPGDRIAQRPQADRSASRLLLLDRVTGVLEDHQFRLLPELLRGNELLILNNTRVIPARLFGYRQGMRSQPPSRATRREHLRTRIEVLLTKEIKSDVWEALVRPGRKMRVGERVRFGEGELEAEIIARGAFGLRTLRLCCPAGATLAATIERLGHVPLPPYISRADDASDRERYQTIFAKVPGAIAAPTAGLHFTPEVLQKIRARGVEIRELTLHVGLGTFQPIHSETIEDHTMHAESYEIPEETVEAIRAARAAGRPIVAVGTTVVRALEDAARRAAEAGSKKLIVAGRADAHLFITPGFRFRVLDALLTNFHLPRSTLLILVSAFAGREKILAAYRHAVEAGYRFYSYGDCMLIR